MKENNNTPNSFFNSWDALQKSQIWRNAYNQRKANSKIQVSQVAPPELSPLEKVKKMKEALL